MKSASATHERALRPVVCAFAAALALLVAACGGGGQPSSSGRRHALSAARQTSTVARPRATRPSRRKPASRPPFRVGSVTFELREPSSPAIADTHMSNRVSVRLLPTVVRYPAVGRPNGQDNPGATPARAAGPFPLLVFSQGYAMPPRAYSWLLDAWTSAGYVVAAPTYPHTDPASPDGLAEADIVNHPADLRFVIATLRRRNVSSRGPLTHLINPAGVAVIGQSDGGDVSLAVAADSCCRDRLVKAAVILSGAELEAFGGSYYSAGSVPLLVVQGTADAINRPGCSIELYDQAPRPKYYLELIGAPHLAPYVDPGPDRTLVGRVVVDFLRRYLVARSSASGALRRDGNAPPVASLTTHLTAPGAEGYCPGAPAP